MIAVNPVVAMNPMMLMMMASMSSGSMFGGGTPGAAPAQAAHPSMARSNSGRPKRAPNAEHTQVEIDAQIQALCRAFNIEDRIARRLNDVMLTREGTFDQDMKALWEVCETAKKPSGFLMVKIQELERGVFTGTGKLDRDLAQFSSRFRLDDRALSKLIEVLQPRQSSRREDLRDLEKHLKGAQHASNAIVTLLTQVKSSGRMPTPPRDRRDRDNDRRRSRSHSCSRSRTRSRPRSRGLR